MEGSKEEKKNHQRYTSKVCVHLCVCVCVCEIAVSQVRQTRGGFVVCSAENI